MNLQPVANGLFLLITVHGNGFEYIIIITYFNTVVTLFRIFLKDKIEIKFHKYCNKISQILLIK